MLCQRASLGKGGGAVMAGVSAVLGSDLFWVFPCYSPTLRYLSYLLKSSTFCATEETLSGAVELDISGLCCGGFS